MTVVVRYMNSLGNNLFQYSFARLMTERLGGRELQCVPRTQKIVEAYSGCDADLSSLWTHFEDAPQHIPGVRIERPRLVWSEKTQTPGTPHDPDPEYLDQIAQERRLELQFLPMHSSYYLPDREKIRGWFQPSNWSPSYELCDDDVVVHVRRSLDYRLWNAIIDLDYYRRVLERMTFRRVFVCGVGIDARTREELAPFKPTYTEGSAIDDFFLIAHANQIVIPNSTFSWWAAFLSRAAKVYTPVPKSGFYSGPLESTRLLVPGFETIRGVDIEPWTPLRVERGFELGELDPETGISEVLVEQEPIGIQVTRMTWARWDSVVGHTGPFMFSNPFWLFHPNFSHEIGQFVQSGLISVDWDELAATKGADALVQQLRDAVAAA